MIDSTVEKTLKSKRRRLAYLNGQMPKLKMKKNITMIILFFLVGAVVYCEHLLINNAQENMVITGLLVPFILISITYCFTQISEVIRVVIESEREIYQICEYIFIHDELKQSINEKELYKKYTSNPNKKVKHS